MKGLQKDYIKRNDILRTPKGKINVSSTITKQLTVKKQLICDFDEYSANILMNQILKSVAHVICRSDEICLEYKKSLKRSLQYMDEVSVINVKTIPWSEIRYHRNNTSYRFLMNICYLIAEGLIMTEHVHSLRIRTVVDDQMMCILYEKFILEYFKKHYKEFQVTASFINWRTDDGMIDFLPQMRSDVMIKYKNTTLVLDAKYYEKSMQGNQFTDKKTIHSNNLYQIFTYVKNKDVNQDGSIMGMLLYAKTDEEIIPHQKYEMSGNKIYIRTLDLNVKFDAIKKQVDEIAKLVLDKETN